MKYIYSITLVLLISLCSIGQTILSPGDLAFVSYNGDNPDEFAFLLLEDIDSATVVSFTDHGWFSTGSFRANEGVIVWTSGVAVTKGSIVTINSTSASIGSTTGSMPAFSSSGDQVFAFQGTVTSPSLIAGLNMDGAWATTASNSNNSALPSTLVGFSLAINPEVDNAYYDCATNGFAGTKSALLAMLTDSSNWITNNSLPNVSNCSSFNIVSGSSTLMLSATVDSNVTCFGLANGGATAVASGGVPPYSYSWSNGDTNSTTTGLSAANYSVTVIDSTGFQVTQTIAITEPSALLATFNVTNATTVGGTDGSIAATISGGTPAYSYSWSNGDTTANNTGLAAGTYLLTVTDANGCIVVDSATVLDPAAIVLVMDSNNISCFAAADGTAKVVASGGSSAYSYMWSNMATTDSIGGLVAGTYKVTVSDLSSSVVAIDSVIISEPSQLQLSFAVTNTSAISATDGAIDLTAVGGTPNFTYNWSNAVTTEDLTLVGAGTYVVTVTDANACQTIDSATVLEPGALASIVITEINYNGPESGTDTSEFIEFVNEGANTVNLNGYFFSQGVTHTFNSNDSIVSGQFYVIAYDSASFRNRYGFDADAVWTSGGLSNGGEDITLVDNFGRTVDSVDFDDSAPWPVNSATLGPDGNGASIELQTALNSNNNDGANWVASALAVPGAIVNGFQVFGSPGNPNTTGISTSQVDGSALKVYPNPTKGIITIERENDDVERIQIISIDGKVLSDIQSTQKVVIMDLSEFSNGVYFLRIGNETQRIVLTR